MSMEDRDGFIWFDGEIVPWREAKVHLLSYTFMHGVGAFEGVRAYSSASGPLIFRLRDHTRRLLDSAKILGMSLPYTTDEIDAAQIEVIKANRLDECYLRPLAFYDGKSVGVSAEGNTVHLAVAAWEWMSYAGPGATQAGLRVKTSSFMRHHVNSAMGKAKATGHYVNSSMAAAEAKAQGFDDGLMLDTTGHVAECSTSNVFAVMGDRLVTPDRSSILAGITRDTVMQLAVERGYAIEERRLTRDELYCADELFLTGTAIEVVPVVELDGRVIGDGKPGKSTRQLQEAYFSAVRGRDESKRHWLTAVDLPDLERAVAAAIPVRAGR